MGGQAQDDARAHLKSEARVGSWKIKDVVLHSLDQERAALLGGADQLAVVLMRLEIDGKKGDVQQIWLCTGASWHVAWGFLSGKVDLDRA